MPREKECRSTRELSFSLGQLQFILNNALGFEGTGSLEGFIMNEPGSLPPPSTCQGLCLSSLQFRGRAEMAGHTVPPDLGV